MDSNIFSFWMDKFIELLERRKVLSPTKRYLVVLHRHKSYVTLEVISKAKQYRIDLFRLPNDCFHELQLLDVVYFKLFNPL